MARKSTGKKLRFEIFKRDGFRCVYCGVTPVQSVLRVDHVIPVAEGGPTDHANLVTSCFDCNAGKGATPLENKRLKKTFITEAHKEHADQIRQYLEIQKEIAAAKLEVAEILSGYWEDMLGPMSTDTFSRLVGVINEWPFDKLKEAIDITSRKLGKLTEFSSYKATNQKKYFNGILRKWRAEANSGQE